ncbi:MAG: Clp protease N-terminal domain-containing protein [Phycisphaeraceae bacterium JB051]
MKHLLSRLKIKLFRWQHPEAEQLTESAKQCCQQANEIARKAGAQHVNSAHLLLGILQTDWGKSLDADGSLTQAIQMTIEGTPSDHDETFKPVLEQAIIEARKLQKSTIDPMLLLLGICNLQDSLGGRLLASHPITSDQLRSTMN